MKILAYIFAFALSQYALLAQNAVIDTVWFDRSSGVINTQVSGINDSKAQLNFGLKSNNNFIKPVFKNISITDGQDEQQRIVSWNFKNESSTQLIGSYVPVVRLIPMSPFTPKHNVYNSMLWPGIGGKAVRSSNVSWLKGLLGWGLLTTGAILAINANNQYNNIATSKTKTQADAATANYNSQFAASMVCFGGAATIWTIDLATIFSKNRKAKAYAIDYGDNIKYVPNNNKAKEIIGSPVILDTRPEYDIAMEKAETFFKENNYENAKPLYIQALTYKPNDELALKRLNATNDKLLIGKRGLPPNLYAQLSFSDGNGNGILEAMESAALKITLSNQGEGYANNLQVKITDSRNDSALSFLNRKLEILRNGESQTIEIPIKAGLDIKTDQHRLEINVLEQYGFDMDPAYLVLNTYALNPSSININDIEIIDKGKDVAPIKIDGMVQPGEKVKVKLSLKNFGQNNAENSSWQVSSKSENVYIDENSGALGTMLAGDVKDIYFYLTPNKRNLGIDTLPLYLSINEKDGHSRFKEILLPIVMEQKPVKPNVVNVQSNLALLQKVVASFEYKSNKFTVNIGKIADIRNIPISRTKNANAVAVVIGVEKYQNVPPAPFAANDASLIEEYFKKRLGIEKVIILRDDEVSSSKLKKIFNPVWGDLQKTIIKNETEIYVYYSGHGMPNKSGSKVYLFPNDGIREGVEELGYDIEQLYTDLNKLEARDVTVILDACFSGSSRSSEKLLAENISGAKGVKIKAINPWIGNSKFTVICSSTGEETSLGLDATESGLFTYYLCNGLLGVADTNADNKITLGELKNYVSENVKNTSVKIAGLQTPQFVGDDNRLLVEY